jgi:hypothetical protein
MMRYKLMIAAVVAGLGAAAGAAGPDNPYGGGTRLHGPPPAEIPTGGAMTARDKARLVTMRFAACMIKAHRTAVLKVIEPEPWQDGADRKLVRIVDEQCLEEGELSMPTNLLRGALYQVLYREKFPSAPPPLPATPIDFTAGERASLSEEARTEVALRQFGDCVARRDAQNAHALIVSAPGSNKETAAINALAPHFSPCVIQGAKWTLDRASVTAILSEVLYREGIAAAPRAGD